MAQGHFHHIQKKSADDQFSISSDSPDCEIDEESEYEGMRATESKGKEKKTEVSNCIQEDKTVRQTQRQLEGSQHSSWYCRTSLWSVPNLPDCQWRSRGVLEQRSRVQGHRCNLAPVCLLPAGHSCWLGHNTHTQALLKMHVETYVSGRLLIPVKKTPELFAVHREESIA